MSNHVHTGLLGDPGAPQTSAPRHTYARNRYRQNLKQMHQSPDAAHQTSSGSPGGARSSTAPRGASPLVSPLQDSAQYTRASLQKGFRHPPRSRDRPTIHYQFSTPSKSAAMQAIMRLWDVLNIPFTEKRYAMHWFVAQEDMVVQYYERLVELCTLIHAHQQCVLMRTDLVQQLQSAIDNEVYDDIVATLILKVRELTIFLLTLDNTASTLLGRPTALSVFTGSQEYGSASAFFNERLFTEKTTAISIVATRFITGIHIIQLQTLINLFFDKCVAWYTAMAAPECLEEYIGKAQKIISLCFLLGLVADGQFDGNFLPALFTSHLLSLKTFDIKDLRVTLARLCEPKKDGGSARQRRENGPPSPPKAPSRSLKRSKSLRARAVKAAADDERVRSPPAPTNSRAPVEYTTLTPSEAFHAILVDTFVRETWGNFEQLCREMDCHVPLVPMDPKTKMFEVYRVAPYNINPLAFYDDIPSQNNYLVPSPFGVERIWLNRPDVDKFSIVNAKPRSIEGITGLNPVQLLGEEEYDLLGYLEWPKVTVKPFFINGASCLMKHLAVENTKRRAKSLPASRFRSAQKMAKLTDSPDHPLLISYPLPPIQPPVVPLVAEHADAAAAATHTPSQIVLPDDAAPLNVTMRHDNGPDMLLDDLAHSPAGDKEMIRAPSTPPSEASSPGVNAMIRTTDLVQSADLTSLFLGAGDEAESQGTSTGSDSSDSMAASPS